MRILLALYVTIALFCAGLTTFRFMRLNVCSGHRASAWRTFGAGILGDVLWILGVLLVAYQSIYFLRSIGRVRDYLRSERKLSDDDVKDLWRIRGFIHAHNKMESFARTAKLPHEQKLLSCLREMDKVATTTGMAPRP